MVEVLLEGVSHPVALGRAGVAVVSDLHRAVGRQHLRAGVGLEAQNGFLQERVPDLGHALDRCAVVAPLDAGKLDLEAQKLHALRPILDPLLAAHQVVVDPAQQVFGDGAQLHVGDVVDEVVEPARGTLFLAVLNGLAIERDGDRSVAVVDAQKRAVLIELRDIRLLVSVSDGHIHRADCCVFSVILEPNGRAQAGNERHIMVPSGVWFGAILSGRLHFFQ